MWQVQSVARSRNRAWLVALTLVPAALGFVGKRIFGRRVRRNNPSGVPAPTEGEGRPNRGTRWARGVVRHPVLALAAGVLTLGVIAVPVASLQLGLPDEGSQPKDTTQRKAYDMLAESFGPGTNGPLMVAVDTRDSGANPAAVAGAVSKKIARMDGVVAATPPTLKTKDAAIINVVPATGPTDEATEELVHHIRDRADDLAGDSGATVLVTGATALAIDFSQVLDEALVPYLALVVGLAFVLLMVVFRSVLVPLKAALGFLLSVLAALGAVVAVFQWGWLGDLLGVEQTGPIMSLTPIFLIGVVFGLAMDYEVFLVTRMREARAHGEEPKQAVVTGFTHGARVVTAAAVIMISVFAGFVGMTEPMVKMMGFGLAIAVLFDAFVVRMTIVPAVLALLGRSAWWLPRWLDRLLPDVDVEGERLQAPQPASQAGGPADGSPPAAVGDAAELLDVHVHQVTGRGVLVAARLLPADGLAGGQIYAGQLGHAVADQDLVHGGGVHTEPAGDRRRAKTLGPPQVQDLPLHRRPGPVRAAVRPAGPVDHPRRAQLPVPIGPAFRRGWADLKPLSGSTQRPPVVHDTLSKLQTAAFGQGCVSLGHEDLQVTVWWLGSSTLTRRSSTLMDLQQSCPCHQPLWAVHLVLAIIVAIRTFLSFSLEVEIEGSLPWRRTTGRAPARPSATPPHER